MGCTKSTSFHAIQVRINYYCTSQGWEIKACKVSRTICYVHGQFWICLPEVFLHQCCTVDNYHTCRHIYIYMCTVYISNHYYSDAFSITWVVVEGIPVPLNELRRSLCWVYDYSTVRLLLRLDSMGQLNQCVYNPVYLQRTLLNRRSLELSDTISCLLAVINFSAFN